MVIEKSLEHEKLAKSHGILLSVMEFYQFCPPTVLFFSGNSHIHTALHPDLFLFFQVIAMFILLYIQIYICFFR